MTLENYRHILLEWQLTRDAIRNSLLLGTSAALVTMAAGAEAHQRAHAGEYDLVVNGTKNESDLAQQVSLAEQMAASGVDALVIAPADSRALVPVLKRARQAGIVVVNIDNKLDAATLEQAGVAIPFVGPDNRAGAKLVGDYVASKLKTGDIILVGATEFSFKKLDDR